MSESTAFPTGEEILEAPGEDPRAQLAFLAETFVFYGLVGLEPQEARTGLTFAGTKCG